MKPAFVARTVRSKRKFSGNVRFVMLSALHKVGRRMEKLLRKTVETWQDPYDIPTFKHHVSFKDKNISVSAGPEGDTEDHANLIWHFLNVGTSERWALLSNDWQSKTVPNSLQSRSGAGSVILRGGEMFLAGMEPFEGIEARNFSRLVSDETREFFRSETRAAISRMIKEMNK